MGVSLPAAKPEFQSNNCASLITTFLFLCHMDENSLLLSGADPVPTSMVMHGISLPYKKYSREHPAA